MPPFIDKLEIVFPVATQAPDWQYKPIVRDDVERAILAPLRSEAEAAEQKREEETAATRVEFFTMVRGED